MGDAYLGLYSHEPAPQKSIAENTSKGFPVEQNKCARRGLTYRTREQVPFVAIPKDQAIPLSLAFMLIDGPNPKLQRAEWVSSVAEQG